jgi:hypothetical protein
LSRADRRWRATVGEITYSDFVELLAALRH